MRIKHLLLSYLILVSITLSAQNSAIKEDLRNPQSTFYVFMHYTSEDSQDLYKAASTLHGVKGQEARDLAVKLRKIIDAKGFRASIPEIPTDPNYLDTISDVDIVNRYNPFGVKTNDFILIKYGERWYFSDESVNAIDGVYKDVFPYGTDYLMQHMPEVGFEKVGSVALWQVVGLFVLFIFAFFAYLLIRRILVWVLSILETSFEKYLKDVIHKGVVKVSKPIAYLIVIAILENYFPILQFNVDISNFFFTGFDIANIIFWVNIFLSLVNVIMEIYGEYAERSESKLDDQLVPVLRNVLRVIVVLAGILKFLTVIGVNPTSVLAGASIGGLALALSAQDTVKNLLGSFMIFLDKPFQIGDWIEAGSVIGSVEEVGFRSTRIRAADTSVFQIPNNQLAELIINNKGMRRYRRYTTTVGVRYDTPPELMQSFIQGIRMIVDAHPDIREEHYNIEFTGFGASSLDIMVNVYFVDLEWSAMQASKTKLHMAILELAAALNVQFAFPSQTVMIEQFPGQKDILVDYPNTKADIEKTVDGFVEDFKKSNPPGDKDKS